MVTRRKYQDLPPFVRVKFVDEIFVREEERNILKNLNNILSLYGMNIIIFVKLII